LGKAEATAPEVYRFVFKGCKAADDLSNDTDEKGEHTTLACGVGRLCLASG